MKIEDIVSRLSLEEKAGLCSGKDNWNLKSIDRLNIPEIMVADGPHGLRKIKSAEDRTGVGRSVPATCFPTASALASSWDAELVERIGRAIGDECRQEKVGVLLGPGVNIKRSPLCGRNFEYYSEDPFLTGRMAASFIKGVQSRGIGTSLKHFAANNQEKRRMTIDAVIDERALREIYLAGFEEAVKSAQPDTVMCAYNRVNGEYCSENTFLLTTILKEEWKHEGIVVSDWGAVNDRVRGLKAGLELEMPGSGGVNDRKIVEAVKSGELEEEVLDRAVYRILKMVFKVSAALEDDFIYDAEVHHELARKAAASSAVLLKNTGILPLSTGSTVAVLGAFAKNPRYQGSGSSLIEPLRVDNFLDSLKSILPDETKILYEEGYNTDETGADPLLIKKAVEAAEKSEIALVFAGLPEISESEGFDRTDLEMPDSHNELIKAVAAANPKTVVILSNGAPVTMPWLDDAAAVLETCLGGQGWGHAAAELLYGIKVPSGKLAETFPLSIESDPVYPNFPGGTKSVIYAESVYVGYRYDNTVLFPFGFGLSYSTFKYSGLSVDKHKENDGVRVSFTVKNEGPYDAEEIVQIYVRDKESTVFRPDKELKEFVKLKLENGESRQVTVELGKRAFSFWDSGQHSWIMEEGHFEILIGSSSADIRLQKEIMLESDDELSSWAAGLGELVPEYYSPDKSAFFDLSQEGPFGRLLGRAVPPVDIPFGTPISLSSSMEDARVSFVGRLLYRIMKANIKKMSGDDVDPRMLAMMEAIVREMPLRKLVPMGEGKITEKQLEALICMMNGKYLKGLRHLIIK